MKGKCHAQPSQDNRDSMVKKLEKGTIVACTKPLQRNTKLSKKDMSKHQEKKAKAKAEKAAKMPTVEEASQVFLKSKQDQLGYLIQSTLRIEQGLATLTKNQESLERIVEKIL